MRRGRYEQGGIMKKIFGNKKVIWVLVFALFAVAAYLVIHRFGDTSKKKVTNYNPEFEEDQTRETNEGGVTGGIRIPGYSEIRVDAGKADVAVDLSNPKDNKVYFQISFYLPDTEETIYTSKLIKPGQHLYNISLNRPLDKGEYKLIIRYATFSADESLSPRNGAEVGCKLIAQ